MDKKKKIIASAVFGVFVIAVGIFAKTVLFASDEPKKTGFSLLTPDVDEDGIDSVTKKKSYDMEIMNPSFVDDSKLIEDEEKDTSETQYTEYDLFQRAQREADSISQATGEADFGQQVDPELLALMQMQEQMMASQAAGSSANAAAGGQQAQTAQVAPEKELTLNEIRSKNEQSGNFFQGAGGVGEHTNTLDLVPGETVDQGILVKGSTVAIRTKQAVRLRDPDLTIPKGAILYGKASFDGGDRLQIDIVSYKVKSKLTPIDLVIYDFDGREGIHLGNKTWPKIPSKVAKEVFNYVKQKGTQAATFGGNNKIDLDEAKDVAIVSTIKEVTEELLDKKRVFMPRKYNLWIYTNTKRERR